MQISSESTHTLTLSGTELRALVASARSSLALPNHGTERQREAWQRLISVASEHVPAVRVFGRVPDRTDC